MINILRLFTLLLFAMSLSLGSMSIAYAGSAKKAQQKQNKEAKKTQKRNAKNYKKTQRPAFNENLKKNRTERKQAKENFKKNKKLLKKAKAEEKSFEKAKNTAEKALNALRKKWEVARDKAVLKNDFDNAKVKNLKDRFELAEINFKNGPEKRWQDRVDDKDKAQKRLNDSRDNHVKKLQAGAGIVKDKIAAKKKSREKVGINVNNNVSTGHYDVIPNKKLKRLIYQKLPPEQAVVYDRLPPNQQGQVLYEKLPNQPVGVYSSAGLKTK